MIETYKMKNPLLNIKHLPEFSNIKTEHVEPALDEMLSENRAELKKLLAQKSFTWDNLMRPLEDMEEKLNVMWSAVNHLNVVVNSKALREVYNKCLPKLSDYGTEISHNKDLFNAIKSIADDDEFKKLDHAQKKIIKDSLRDFHLAGVDLSEKDKKKFAELSKKLSQLTTKFEENILDATEGWHYHVTDENQLKGLPEHALDAAKQTAESKKLDGWVFTLDLPSYIAVMMYAENRDMRHAMYDAYVTRASDQGPNAGKWDNSQLMVDILQVRYELAKLLDFNNYAERSLARKMAKTPKEVLEFLASIVSPAKPKANQEYEELKAFAKQDLEPWDLPYYSEKLKHKNFSITQEELRPYFPEDQVLKGLFSVVNKLYGLKISEKKDVNVWHKDVRFFEIYDENDELRGQFYLDLYARLKKRGGAWMDECRVRRKHKDGKIETPVTYLTCNFHPPVKDKPALLTHDDVTTLFHEFGHGLQHMLTKIDYADVSGINGVPWDAVELPSQFMENWCWEEEALQLISKHYKTGETIPKEKIDKLRAAKHFQSAMLMIRQLEFGLFDFRLHMEFDPKKQNQVQEVLDQVRKEVTVVPTVPYNRFQHSFSHIFAGGYAAGYYSYMWADVLASDAYSKFEEDGIFNRDTGRSFMENILETGGSEEPMILFKRFRGREPTIDALLHQNGIVQ